MSIVVHNGSPSKGMSYQEIAIWSDGIWCLVDDLEDFINQGYSDDYTIESLPATYDDDNIEMFVLGLISGAYVMEDTSNE